MKYMPFSKQASARTKRTVPRQREDEEDVPVASPPCAVPRGPAAPGAGSSSGDPAMSPGAGAAQGTGGIRPPLARGPLGAQGRAALPGTRRRSPHAPRPGGASRGRGRAVLPWGAGWGPGLGARGNGERPLLPSKRQEKSVKRLNTFPIQSQSKTSNFLPMSWETCS